MASMKIHVLHVGEVCVSPYLPFGGEGCNVMKASGLFEKKADRLWLPVSSYLIEHPKGLVLVNSGWSRAMSPHGIYDKRAQIASLGSRLLFHINQGVVAPGKAIDEQLKTMGIEPSELDYVLLTHLDCDHASGLELVREAKAKLVSEDELASVGHGLVNKVRYQKKWWDGLDVEPFQWNGTKGPFGKSYDLFGDGTIELIAIPGHSAGLFAVKVTAGTGQYVLLVSDGAYGRKSWEELVLPGVSEDKERQMRSLEWIRERSLDEACIEVLANHDAEVKPHAIELG